MEKSWIDAGRPDADNRGVPIDPLRFPALLQRAAQGDENAATELFAEYHPRLERFLRGLEPKAADDLVGEVWLAVARGLPGFDGGAAEFSAWLFTIARNRLADHRRTAARRRTDPVGDLADRGLDATDAASDPAVVVVGRLSAAQAVALVATHLPAEQAEVVLLRVVGGLDVAQVAAVLGRTAGWVRVNQHRALQRLAAVVVPDSATAGL